MLDRVAQRCPWQSSSILIQEAQQPRQILFSCFANPASYSLLDQICLIMSKNLGDFEGIIQVALPDEIIRADNRRPALPQIFRARQFIKNIAWLIKQVATNHIGCT